MFEKILIGLFTGLVGLWLGHRLRLGGESASKRQRFRSYLDVLRAKIDAKGACDFVFNSELREASKLDAEALEVRHFIPRRLVHRFDTAISDYKAARFDQWAGLDQKRQQERDVTNEKSKEKLISNLDKLHRCAWWMA